MAPQQNQHIVALVAVLRRRLLYRSFLGVHNRAIAALAEVFAYAADLGAYIALYRDFWCRLLHTRTINTTDKSAVEGAVYGSFNEYARMAARNDYYKINAGLCCRFLEKLLAQISAASDMQSVVWLARLVDRHLTSGLVLVNHYYANILSEGPPFGVGVTTLEPEFMIYRESLQSIYAPTASPRRVDLHLPTNSIRAIIELRIKRSMAIFAVLNKRTGGQIPVKMEIFFRVYEAFVQSDLIDVVIPLTHIRRIYRWASTYLHMGIASYPWLPLFCLDYMARLLNGRPLGGGGFDVDSGIMATKETVQLYQRSLRRLLDRSFPRQKHYIHAYTEPSCTDPSRA